MKDGTAKAIVAAVCVVAVYGIYVTGSVAAGDGMPDGVMFGSIVAAVAGILGYTVKMTQDARKGA